MQINFTLRTSCYKKTRSVCAANTYTTNSRAMGQLKYCTFLLAIVACTLATPTLHKSKGGTATVQHPPQAVYVPAPAPQPVQIVHPPPAKIVKPKPVFVKPVIVQPVLVVKPVVVASGGGGGHGHGGHHGKKHFLGKFK